MALQPFTSFLGMVFLLSDFQRRIRAHRCTDSAADAGFQIGSDRVERADCVSGLSDFKDVENLNYHSVAKRLFGRNDDYCYGFTIYYANFCSYVAQIIYRAELEAINVSGYDDFGLKAIVPKNGKGYDTPIWNAFFTVERTDKILLDNDSKVFIEQIKNVKAEKSVEDIKNASSLGEIEKIIEAKT